MSYGSKNNRITSGELLATSERLASAVARRGSWMPAWVGLLNGVTEGGGHDWGVRTFRIKNRPLHHEIVSKSFAESHTQRLARRKAPRKSLNHLMTPGLTCLSRF